uniref:Translocation protein SEC62 n=1 Tax=Rhabditophanes sp. KR3021 TaxID=114890 RepID=A0AC35TIC6_9BILA
HKNEKGESLWNVMPREWAPKNESHTEVLPEKADMILENSEGSHFFVPCIVLKVVWLVLIGIVVSELFTFIVLMIVRKKLVQRRKLDELSEREEATDQEEVLKLATANKTGPSNTGNENVVEDDKEEVNEDGTPKVSDQANNSEAAVTDQDGNSPDKDRKPNQKEKPGFKKKPRAANKPKPLIKGSTAKKGPANKSKPTPRKKAPPIPKCAPKKAPAPRRRKK